MRYTVIFFLLISAHLSAQQTSQNIRGTVTDRNSKQPLQGATVVITETEKNMSVVTDSLGSFVLRSVPTGRTRIQVSYTGYETFLSDYIILNAA
jgi:hypothetical protein